MSTFLKITVIRDAQERAQLNKKGEGGKKNSSVLLVCGEVSSF